MTGPPTARLDAWVAAGLIDAATARRIADHEAAAASGPAAAAPSDWPRWQVTLVGIAGSAIAIGLFAILTANWREIAGSVRLIVHGGLLTAAAVAFFRLRGTDGWGREIALAAVGALGLAMIAHLGQITRSTMPMAGAFGLFLLGFGPLLAVEGRRWLTRAGLGLATMIAIVSAAPLLRWTEDVNIALVGGALALAAVAARHWLRSVAAIPPLAVILGFASYATTTLDPRGDLAQLYAGLALLPAAALAWRSDRSLAGVLAIVAAALVLAPSTSGSGALSALLFFAMWGAIAALGLVRNVPAMTQVATVVILARMLVLLFQFGGARLGLGGALLFGGTALLGIGWVTRRWWSRRA